MTLCDADASQYVFQKCRPTFADTLYYKVPLKLCCKMSQLNCRFWNPVLCEHLQPNNRMMLTRHFFFYAEQNSTLDFLTHGFLGMLEFVFVFLFLIESTFLFTLRNLSVEYTNKN